MKQTLQLKLGQHLTMTPQLQQAIRLLQLSTIDLSQEIQQALESNPLLETEESYTPQAKLNGKEHPSYEQDDSGGSYDPSNDSSDEQSSQADSTHLSEDLSVDGEWSEMYDNYPSGMSTSQDSADNDFLLQRVDDQSLHHHLIWQMNLTPFTALDMAIATAIIDDIDEDGYFRGDLDEIRLTVQDEDVTIDDVMAVLHRIQAFDPPGVGAQNPQECLLIQLRQLPDETSYRALAIELCQNHFNLLAEQDQEQIKRRLKIDDNELTEITRLIRSLNPRPGSAIENAPPQYVIPDVFVSKQKNRWKVELNPEAIPRIRINAEYANLIRRADQSEDNTFLKNHLQEARWFIKSLLSRNETILRVARKIVEFQQGFFEYGEEAMKPLVLRDIAEAIDMHESTISRVTTQKFMYTPRGTYEFKYFFSSHVSTDAGGECSSTAIRALIKKLIAAERPNKPLSDNKIAAILSEQGINVARRTVAKYRESIGIPPSNERKRLI